MAQTQYEIIKELYRFPDVPGREWHKEERTTFMEILQNSKDVEDFASTLVEWFFSGDWIYDPHDNGKQSWIVRFSDNSLHGCYCTYADAVILGRKLADEKGLGFVVV